MAYSDVTYITIGTSGFNVTAITPVKIPSTIKQTLGKRIAKHQIPGKDALDWRLNISGIIIGTTAGPTKDAKRGALESYQDGTKHHYNDGHVTGSFVIENDGLTFNDSGDTVFNRYNFTLSLIEWGGS